MTGTSTPIKYHTLLLSQFLSADILSINIRATQARDRRWWVCHVIIIWLAHQHQVLHSVDVFLSTDIVNVSELPKGQAVLESVMSCRYQLPILSASGFLAPDSPLLVSAPFLFLVHLHSTWNDLPFPLWQKPSLDSFKSNLKNNNFKSPNCRLSIFSAPCWCLHQFQVSRA